MSLCCQMSNVKRGFLAWLKIANYYGDHESVSYSKIRMSWNGPSETKPNPENCKNCSSMCAYDCAQLSVHNTAQNISGNLPSYLQTIIIAQMLRQISHAYTSGHDYFQRRGKCYKVGGANFGLRCDLWFLQRGAGSRPWYRDRDEVT